MSNLPRPDRLFVSASAVDVADAAALLDVRGIGAARLAPAPA